MTQSPQALKEKKKLKILNLIIKKKIVHDKKHHVSVSFTLLLQNTMGW